MDSQRKLLSAVGLGVLAALPPTSVSAAIDEIIVTTRKRVETLQDAPLAVTAFTADTIARQSITSVRELANQVPGFNFNEGFGRRDDRPAVRGSTSIGTPDFGVESGTAIFIDGVYISADTSAFGLNDLERVEFVRGPQSALYGRNAYAGAVNFITKTPGDEFSFDGFASFAEHDQYEFSANVAGPIVEGKLSGSLFARYYEYGGEYTNPDDGKNLGAEQTTSISGALFFEPNEDWSAKLRLAYSEDDDSHPAFVQIENSTFGFNDFGASRVQNDFGANAVEPVGVNSSPTRDQYFKGELPFVDPKPAETDTLSLFGEPGLQRESFIATLRTDWDVADGHSLTFLAGYRNDSLAQSADNSPNVITSDCDPGTPTSTFDGCPSPLPFGFIFTDPTDPIATRGEFIAVNREDTKEMSFELRLASPQEQDFRWLVGGFYYNFEIDPIDAVVNETDVTGIRETDNWALFGLAEYDFTDRFTTTLELRYAEDTKTKDTANLDPVEETFHSFNPKLTLDWALTDDANLYAIVSRGNKPGGFNDETNLRGGSGDPNVAFTEGVPVPTFDEETAWVYEVGSKSSWFDDRFRINASLFFADITDAQLTNTFAAIVDGAATGRSQIINIESVETWGGELELQANPTENLFLSLGYAYVHPEIKEGGTQDQDDIFGDPSVAGNVFPRVSQHEVNWSADYRRPIPNTDLDLTFNVNGSYDSKRYVQVHNLAEFGEATVWNSRIGIDHENFSIALFGKNLTDEDAYVDVLRFRDVVPVGRRAFIGTYRKGRQFGIEARFRF